MHAARIRRILSGTAAGWSRDNVPMLSAALAYYTFFSLAPLLVVAVAVAAIVFGEAAAQGEVSRQLSGTMGPATAQAVEDVIAATRESGSGWAAAVTGTVLLFVGAATAFQQLQTALNVIWKVQPGENTGWREFLRKQLAAFSVVLGTGVLLLASLAAGTLLSASGRFLGGLMPGIQSLWRLAELSVSFILITLLFGIIYKVLPDVAIRWKDVRAGAALAALLFIAGKYLIGLYLAYSAPASAYGAAGSLVIILIWIYYSAQILFTGAEFTRNYAQAHDSRPVPAGRGAGGRAPQQEEEYHESLK